MSKVFDRINRSKDLIEDLQNTIEADEVHIISKLLNASISARCENVLSEVFEKDTRAQQTDCEKALAFAYYHAKTLDPVNPTNY